MNGGIFNGEGRPLKVDQDGRVITTQDSGSTSNSSAVNLTISHPAIVVVGTSTIQLLAANANRKGALFVNKGSATVYISIDGAAATVARGIPVDPNGSFGFSAQQDGGKIVTSINAISPVAGNNVFITETT